MTKNFKPFAQALARAANEKKGEEITLLNIGRTSSITDYFLLVTTLSKPHLKALEEEIKKEARELGFFCSHKSLPKSDQWQILDFGGVMVHLMSQEARHFYALEKLHPEARPLVWEKPTNGTTKPRAKKKADE